MSKAIFTCVIVSLLMLIQACSNNSGFQLRKSVELNSQFKTVSLQGIKAKTEFTTFFADALAEAGGELVTGSKKAKTEINFSKFEEGRRVIAYTSERTAREFLVYLRVEYGLSSEAKEDGKAPKYRINIDRSYLYDSDFALGKAEEEKRVKQSLYEEAARLIMLRLKYAEK